MQHLECAGANFSSHFRDLKPLADALFGSVDKAQLPTIPGAREAGSVQPDATQARIIARLHDFGLEASWYRDNDSYVPRGLADDDGQGPAYSNYGIQIGW